MEIFFVVGSSIVCVVLVTSGCLSIIDAVFVVEFVLLNCLGTMLGNC